MGLASFLLFVEAPEVSLRLPAFQIWQSLLQKAMREWQSGGLCVFSGLHRIGRARGVSARQ
jgi:hypothetical protein